MREHLLPELGSISAARHMVAVALKDFPADFRAEAMLVTSELVTNAVIHARTDVTLDVQIQNRCVTIEVDDDSPVVPQLRDGDPDSMNGRGLHIVDALAESCGVRQHPNNGKSVWAKMKATY